MKFLAQVEGNVGEAGSAGVSPLVVRLPSFHIARGPIADSCLRD